MYQERGRWRVNVWVLGERKTKTFPASTNKKIVEDYERKLKLSQIDPEFSEKKRQEPIFAEFADRWLKQCCGVEHSYSYLKKCEQTIASHLSPCMGSRRIGSITNQDLMSLQRELKGRDYAVQTINNILATCSSIFKYALFLNLIGTNPVGGMKRLKKSQTPEMQVWTLEERDRFLQVLRRENFAYFQVSALALFSGLRPSELRGLLRDAIDFEQCQVRVFRQ